MGITKSIICSGNVVVDVNVITGVNCNKVDAKYLICMN